MENKKVKKIVIDSEKFRKKCKNGYCYGWNSFKHKDYINLLKKIHEEYKDYYLEIEIL